jgi:hypothetical protein
MRQARLVGLLVASAALGSCNDPGEGSGSPGIEADSGSDAGPDAMPAPDDDPCLAPPPEQGAYWVSISGSDDQSGTKDHPWKTLSHAIRSVPDGSLILVRPGRYEGRVHLDTRFEQGIVVRSLEPYRARLRHSGTVVRAFYGAGITLEGFDIAHTGLEVEPVLVHIQDLVEGPDTVERIVLRNNVLHDSRAADIVKINNGARAIRVERNLLYNQADHDEQIDIDSATDVVVQDNVLFNDFAGSGRYNDNDTGSFIAVKGGSSELEPQSLRIEIRRNVFMNWQGSVGSHFVLIGGYGKPHFEAEDVLVENNLLLGNSSNKMRAPFGVKGGIDIVFRHNTITGNLPSGAYGMRLTREGDSPPNDNIRFYNNIWSDPTGTMYDFSDTPPADTTSFLLRNNLYYNGGVHMPADDAELVNIWDDARRIMADPLLPQPSALATPIWDFEAGRFADGSRSICRVFERLVETACRPAPASPAAGAADPEQTPSDDLSGRPRPHDEVDIGACQRP